MHSFIVDESSDALRIDQFIAKMLPDISRSYSQKLIRENHVTVNESTVKVAHRVSAGDQVKVDMPEPEETDLQGEDIPLDVAYEDDHILVLNKAPGMVVHPGAGVREGTVVNALIYRFKSLSSIGGRLRPGIVHRLDKNTSGLMVVAKDDQAHLGLQKQFSEKTTRRVYKTLVWGKLKEPQGTIETYINRSKTDRKRFTVAENGKKAVTHYKLEQEFDYLSLLDVWLETGRTHQIRVHLNYLHHPVFGDPEYAGRQKQVNRLSSLSQKKKCFIFA